MTEEVKNGYLNEIKYQKHMIENLQRWLTLSFLISTIGVTLLYFFHDHIIDIILLVILTVIGVFGVMLFGWGIYAGRKNVNKVIDQFQKISHL